ncbi:protein translocase subunit SecF [Arcanobacterium pinnipediorum]|uniref:Protein-export membrane protein SecF n=1 Tax=Arcanobacterium pinnipediorum TaxID=1503041 RepID=A0ABY5AJM6_9ACTO|nr:protein translocase subunit SecF [Arcanobacterium pinnipediorum]USR80166.1 protein translocase subunit SecF [Arcanobacterium pinnipediorum]
MLSMYKIGNDLYTGRSSVNIIGRRKIWLVFALVLMVLSLLAFAIKSPNTGIEFRGGSQFTVSGTTNASHQPAYDVIKKVGQDDAPRVANLGSSSIRVQTAKLDDQQTQEVRDALASAYGVQPADVTSTFVGPSWGADILSKAIRAMIIFMVLISLVLTVYFRSWTIAVGANGALVHDFIITLGVYWWAGFEITPATVIGLLTIMGYSLYDTVVVFDKVRENTENVTSQYRYTYEETANQAMNQSLIRSLNTSITGLLPVTAILFIGVYILGADTLRDLALVMFVGMLLSTLSSLIIAAPLAVFLAMRNPKIREHTAEVLARRSESSEPAEQVEPDHATLGSVEVIAGGHQGHRAQPKRQKKRKKR